MTAPKRRLSIARLCALAVTILIGLAPAQTALAHAALISSQPEDGAVLREAPERFILIFNEPVAPLRLQLIDRLGKATPLTEIVQHNMTVIVRPPSGLLDQGTHALSWRVVSSDGRPVGGTVIFSVGQPDATTPIRETKSDPLLNTTIWLVRIAIFITLFFGLGGAVFANWLAAKSALEGTDGKIVRRLMRRRIGRGYAFGRPAGARCAGTAAAGPWPGKCLAKRFQHVLRHHRAAGLPGIGGGVAVLNAALRCANTGTGRAPCRRFRPGCKRPCSSGRRSRQPCRRNS